MGTVFRPGDKDKARIWAEFLKSLDCQIKIHIEEDCKAIPYEQWTPEQKERLARLYFGEEEQ